ncbi:MAG: methyltransferase domain-containing protein, partial [bacterium]|nr:methyltransferase domain-containing protein [bacterium]
FTAAIPFGEWEGKLEYLCDDGDLAHMKALHEKHPTIFTRDLYENLGKSGCPAAKQTLYISEYGDIMPCAFVHISFGNLKYESITDIRKRILEIEEFAHYHPVCLPAEDMTFIDNHLSKTFGSETYPISYEEAFSERLGDRKPSPVSRNIAKRERPCPLCGANETTYVTAGREHEFDNTTDDLFCVVKCKQCGLVYLNPIPEASTLNIIYPDNYYCHNYTYTQKNAKPSLIGRVKRTLSKHFGHPRQIRKIMKRMPAGTGEPLHILDVGCGNGSALDAFRKESGREVITCGLDYSKNALKIVAEKGHKTIEANIDSVELEKNRYDIIFSSNLIEHIAHPQRLMEQIYGALKPGGLFMCETPNYGSVDAKIFGPSGHWGGFHFPRHWTFYTAETLGESAKKAGFDIDKVNYKPVPIFWLWTMHSRVYRGRGDQQKADKKYPLIEQKSNFLRSFFLKGVFTFVDMAQLLFARRTSLMVMLLRK